MIDLVYAHPYPDRSRANRVLFDAVRDLPGVRARVLYDLYPDFSIDVVAEQNALSASSALVWQHPLYWYSVPPLLKLWFDKVLAHGWAYGDGSWALQGKPCLWVVTASGDTNAYGATGVHGHCFDQFAVPIEQTARFCRMSWEPPLVVQGAHDLGEAELEQAGRSYRQRLTALVRTSEDGSHHA